jgi:hypothetical protein
MVDDPDDERGRTRRRYMKYGGAVISGGLLTGCTGDGGSDGGSGGDGGATDADTPTATLEPTATPDPETPTSSGNTDVPSPTAKPEPSYTAELSPVGSVTLEEPPTSVFTHFPWFPDMASALGQGDTINNFWWEGTAAGLAYFTAGFEDFEVEWADEAGAYGFSKEQVYELDSDLHLVDPAWVTTQDDWTRADVEEVVDNVGPWLGNYYSSFHATPPEGWTEGYEYDELWDLFDCVATLYGERARYEALRTVHEDLLATVESGLPPESERPTAAYLSISEDLSSIYQLRLNAPGYWNAHTRPLGAVDAFGDAEFSGPFRQVDLEALLAADPDAILALWTVTDTFDFGTLTENLEDDPVAGELSAVGNDRVYRQGTRWQGPLTNLFQLEMTAKQLYPEQFGQWPAEEGGDGYPEFDEDEQLFDHQRVAEILGGDVKP